MTTTISARLDPVLLEALTVYGAQHKLNRSDSVSVLIMEADMDACRISRTRTKTPVSLAVADEASAKLTAYADRYNLSRTDALTSILLTHPDIEKQKADPVAAIGRQKVSLTFHPNLLEHVDRRSKESGLSRSQVVEILVLAADPSLGQELANWMPRVHTSLTLSQSVVALLDETFPELSRSVTLEYFLTSGLNDFSLARKSVSVADAASATAKRIANPLRDQDPLPKTEVNIPSTKKGLPPKDDLEIEVTVELHKKVINALRRYRKAQICSTREAISRIVWSADPSLGQEVISHAKRRRVTLSLPQSVVALLETQFPGLDHGRALEYFLTSGLEIK